MKRLSIEEQNAVHRIFNHVDSLINYYGHKTLDQAIQYVSENRWIMFPVRGINSIKEGKEMALPNIYITTEKEEIRDNGMGRITGSIGMTYHNDNAMKHLREIIKRPKSMGQKLTKIISVLNNNWEAGATHKVKTECHESVPHYDPQPFISVSVLTVDAVKTAIENSDWALPALGDTYHRTGNPVKSRITVYSIEKPTDPSMFDNDVKEIFDVFTKVLTVG
jgi:hypothetical protein